MKHSQIAVLSVGATLVALIIVIAVVGRVALSQIDPETLGSSEIVYGNPALTGFSGLEIRGSWRVNVTQGDDWQVDLSYPENLENRLEVSVLDNRLRLELNRRGRRFGRSIAGITANIVMPQLEELELAGSSQLEVSGFRGDRLEVDVAGAVQLTGRDGMYDELELAVAGASDIDLRGIFVTHAHVDLAGASDVTLAMDGGELSGSMTGAGQIQYYGSVSQQTVDIIGFGRIAPAEYE